MFTKNDTTLQDLVLKLEHENDVLNERVKQLQRHYDALFEEYEHLSKSYYELLAASDPEWAKEVCYEVSA